MGGVWRQRRARAGSLQVTPKCPKGSLTRSGSLETRTLRVSPLIPVSWLSKAQSLMERKEKKPEEKHQRHTPAAGETCKRSLSFPTHRCLGNQVKTPSPSTWAPQTHSSGMVEVVAGWKPGARGGFLSRARPGPSSPGGAYRVEQQDGPGTSGADGQARVGTAGIHGAAAVPSGA